VKFRALVVTVLLAASAATPPFAAAQGEVPCVAGQQLRFAGGFAALKAELADWQGEPTTCEFADPTGSGDILQRTTTGLAFWRRATNTASFTNGIDHWALVSSGLVYWRSAAADPPADAIPAKAHPCIRSKSCMPPGSGGPLLASVGPRSAAPEPTLETRNGPRTFNQLRDELASAGYAGPWDLESVGAAYAGAGPSGIPPYSNDTSWNCLATNPSCGRDPWWAEHNELLDTARVIYQAIGARFVSERSFVEAVNLLWQSSEGKQLLSKANESGVTVISRGYDRQFAFATYLPERKTVVVNDRFLTAPTWMLADVLAHELSHAADDARGLHMGHTSSECIAGELSAYQVERRFLIWLTRSLVPEGLPSVAVISGRLSAEHGLLANSLFQLGFSNDIPQLVERTYEGTC
jgi:hypothetical protein